MYILFYVSDRPDNIVSETYFSGYIQYSFTVVSKVDYLKFHALLGQWKYGGKYFVSYWDVTPCPLGGMCFLHLSRSKYPSQICQTRRSQSDNINFLMLF
jgi:hypothetical protein